MHLIVHLKCIITVHRPPKRFPYNSCRYLFPYIAGNVYSNFKISSRSLIIAGLQFHHPRRSGSGVKRSFPRCHRWWHQNVEHHSNRHAGCFDGLIKRGLGPGLGEQTWNLLCVWAFFRCVRAHQCTLLLLQAKAIITKYLSVDENKLGSAELNAVGGPNLCSLDVEVLRDISQESLR